MHFNVLTLTALIYIHYMYVCMYIYIMYNIDRYGHDDLVLLQHNTILCSDPEH